MIRKGVATKNYARDSEQIVIFSTQGVKITKKAASVLGAKAKDNIWFGFDDADDVVIYLSEDTSKGAISDKMVVNMAPLNAALAAKAGLKKINGHTAEFEVSELKEETDGSETLKYVVLTLTKVEKVDPKEEATAAETGDTPATIAGKVPSKQKEVLTPAVVD